MDLHKPKAAHSPREFAIELVTIVIGVLIALAAEAAVEHIRISHAVEYSRSDFIDEITRNRADVNRNLADAHRLQATLEALLQEGMRYAQGKGSIGAQHAISRSFPHLRSAAWSAALSTQVMGHFPHEEGRAVAAAYDEQASFAEMERAAQQTWFDLAVYSFAGTASRDQVELAMRHVTVSYAYLRAIEEEETDLLRVYDAALKGLRHSGK